MYRLKLTASIVGLWARGDRQGVINALHGVYNPPTEAMVFGTQKHKEWENEVNETGCLPAIFGGDKIVSPKTEQYYTREINEWLKISGVLDLQYGKNGEVIVDYKTGGGKSSASQYASSLQVGFYALLCPEAKMFKFLHYNRATDKITSATIHLTPARREQYLDEIMSIACDIRSWHEDFEPDYDGWSVSSHKQVDNVPAQEYNQEQRKELNGTKNPQDENQNA